MKDRKPAQKQEHKFYSDFDINREHKENKKGFCKPKSALMSRLMSPAHKRMSRVLGYVLTAGTPDAWRGFAVVAMARLSTSELACLAKAALIALPDDVADLVWSQRTGAPLPTFMSLMDDARYWASNASRREKKAYWLAIWDEMAASDQADAFKYITSQKERAA